MVSMNDRFHRSEEQFREQIEYVLTSAVQEERITTRDEELLRLFIAELKATANISNSRAAKIIGLLVGARRFIGPFIEVDTASLYLGIDRINSHDKFKQNTKADIIRSLKRFLLWLHESEYASKGLKIEKVKKVKSYTYQPSKKTSEDLLTEDEIRLMIENANNARDRAIIAVLYEGGFRIGELGELQWKQVQFNDWNVAISTDFKTGKPRHIPLVMARSYLQAYCNEYQGKVSPDKFVFLTRQGQPLQYQGVVKMIRNTARNAGIDRHITAHLFRHSRITHLIRQGFQESVIKRMMWGSVETDMFKTYLHLCDNDVDNEIAQKYGVKHRGRPTKESKALEPVQCSKCYTINGPTSRFCDQCGAPLTAESIQSLDAATEILSSLLVGPGGEDILREIISLKNKSKPVSGG